MPTIENEPLGHVTLLLRRRADQLAIAASIGMTRRQLIAAASTSTLVTTLAGVVIGVPPGWAISRVVLVEIGPGVGIELDGPGTVATVLVGCAMLVVSMLIALIASSTGLTRRNLDDLRRAGSIG